MEPNFTNEENLAVNDDFLGAPELEEEYAHTEQMQKMQHGAATVEEMRRRAFPDPLAADDDAPPEAPKVSKAAGKERIGPIPNKQFWDDSDDEDPALSSSQRRQRHAPGDPAARRAAAGADAENGDDGEQRGGQAQGGREGEGEGEEAAGARRLITSNHGLIT